MTVPFAQNAVPRIESGTSRAAMRDSGSSLRECSGAPACARGLRAAVGDYGAAPKPIRRPLAAHWRWQAAATSDRPSRALPRPDRFEALLRARYQTAITDTRRRLGRTGGSTRSVSPNRGHERHRAECRRGCVRSHPRRDQDLVVPEPREVDIAPAEWTSWKHRLSKTSHVGVAGSTRIRWCVPLTESTFSLVTDARPPDRPALPTPRRSQRGGCERPASDMPGAAFSRWLTCASVGSRLDDFAVLHAKERERTGGQVNGAGLVDYMSRDRDL